MLVVRGPFLGGSCAGFRLFESHLGIRMKYLEDFGVLRGPAPAGALAEDDDSIEEGLEEEGEWEEEEGSAGERRQGD